MAIVWTRIKNTISNVTDLYNKSVAINAFWRLVGKISEGEVTVHDDEKFDFFFT